MCLTDIAHTANWWSTLHQTMPWETVPSYAGLIGFTISQIVPDLLHMWNLGVSRDLLGSALKLVLTERRVFDAPTLPERLKLATESLRHFAKQNRYPLRLRKLTRAKLCWKSKKYPMLSSSGYDAYVVGVWLEHELSMHTASYQELCTMLWASNKAFSLLYSAGRFLDQSEKDSLGALGDLFLRVYLSMAAEANQQHKLLFRIRPKWHMLCHIFRSPRAVNPSRYSTWMDEDFLKKCGRTLGLTDVRGSQHRLLQRWLMSIPHNIQKNLGRLAT